MFEVGDMVVCVDAESGFGRWVGDKPQEGGIYTVNGFSDENLLLAEIQNCDRTNPRDFDDGYAAFRFRKIKKPDISALREVVESVKTPSLMDLAKQIADEEISRIAERVKRGPTVTAGN